MPKNDTQGSNETNLFHAADKGALIDIGDVSVGYGTVPYYRCSACGHEIDATDYDDIAHLLEGDYVDYKGRVIDYANAPCD